MLTLFKKIKKCFCLKEKKDKRKNNLNEINYFAYGGNINKYVMKKRGINYTEEIIGKLDKYRLVFNIPGIRYVDPAFANVEYTGNENDHVLGVIYKMDSYNFNRIDSYENNLYKTIEVDVEQLKKNKVICKAIAFINKDSLNTKKNMPSERYINAIIEGMEQHKFPQYYINDVKSIDIYKRFYHKFLTIRSPIVWLFDYIQSLF